MSAFPTWSAGEIVTAAKLGIYTTNLTALCQVRRAAAQSIPDSAITVLTFDTEDLDPLAWHDNATNNNRVTPTLAGWYRVSWAADWQDDTDYTNRIIQVRKNGAAISPVDIATDFAIGAGVGGNYRAHASTPLIQMNGTTDYLDTIAFQGNTSVGANTVAVLLLVELVYPT